MGKSESKLSKLELEALHSALVRARKEDGTLDQIIPVEEWETMLVRTIGTMTRQSCQDKTWAMSRLGMVRRVDREGVYVLDTQPVTA